MGTKRFMNLSRIPETTPDPYQPSIKRSLPCLSNDYALSLFRQAQH